MTHAMQSEEAPLTKIEEEEVHSESVQLRVIKPWANLEIASGPLHEKNEVFRAGELMEYPSFNNSNMSQIEKEDLETKYVESILCHLRKAAECHRQTRKYIQNSVRPGIRMIDLCQRLEAKSKELIAAKGLECGWGFPTGCSLNNVAAHYTPNYDDRTVLQKSDIMKIDFGVHVQGYIIDSAFTVAFDPCYDPLIQATIDGTNAGLKEAGIDARFADIGEAIQEVIESFEMEKNGRILSVKPIANLQGHSIEPYRIHGGKSVPIVKTADHSRMQEGEIYAIETFASTGHGQVVESGACSHYSRNPNAGRVPLRSQSSKQLLHGIDKAFDTLPFCRRWLDDIGFTRHTVSLKFLVEAGLVTDYPPLADIPGSYTSQMEHTIFIGATRKEILSRGDDY